jgi:hypothetical protein
MSTSWSNPSSANGIDVHANPQAGSQKPSNWQYKNWLADMAPTGSDDHTQGFSTGSRWMDLVGEHEYVCVKSGPAGSAVWKQTTV